MNYFGIWWKEYIQVDLLCGYPVVLAPFVKKTAFLTVLECTLYGMSVNNIVDEV